MRSEPSAGAGKQRGLAIFQDDEVMLLGDRVDFLPPFETERRTGGVLTASVGGRE